MATVVSATTRSMGGGRNKRASFISRASVLLRDAVRYFGQDQFEDALDLTYQAALRTAGARIASSPVARRRRLPKGAWNQLALVDERGKYWAELLAPYSKLRSRVMNGLDRDLDPAQVSQLIELVGQFLDEVEMEGTNTNLAA